MGLRQMAYIYQTGTFRPRTPHYYQLSVKVNREHPLKWNLSFTLRHPMNASQLVAEVALAAERSATKTKASGTL